MLDFTQLTDAIDVSGISAAVLAAGALIILVSLAVMGVRKVQEIIYDRSESEDQYQRNLRRDAEG
jgi:hypothetical protein